MGGEHKGGLKGVAALDRDFQDDLAFVVEQVRADAARLPAGVCPLPDGDTVFDQEISTNWAIALVFLAGWMCRALNASDEVRRRSLLGAYYGLRYIVRMDVFLDRDRGFEALSGAPTDGGAGRPAATRESLDTPLNFALLHLLAIRQYQRIFPADSPFWDHLERYYTMWIESLNWERDTEQYAGLSFRDALEKEANKSAALCVSCAAAALGANRADLLPSLERAAMLSNMIIDLIDDARDWFTDLAEGRHNSFVTLAVSDEFIPPDTPPAEAIPQAMLSTPLLDRYVEEVGALVAEARAIVAPLNIALWLAFLDDQLEIVAEFRDQFRSTVSRVTSQIVGR